MIYDLLKENVKLQFDQFINKCKLLSLKIYSQLIQLLQRVKMKTQKPQSLTTDTRLSQSHFFSNSLLNKTNFTTSSQKQHKIPHSFQQQDSKQNDFLKVKNLQLQQRVKRMAQEIKDLQNNKNSLLKMNQQYTEIINQYYRDGSKSKSYLSLKPTQSYSTNKTSHQSKQKISRKQNNISYHKKQKNTQKSVINTQPKSQNIEQVLHELQKDHRNLSKHCLVMQSEIKNYAIELEKFNQMKAQLFAVNHTSPKELIAQLEEVTQENRELKKQNNRLSFELEKFKAEYNKLKKAKQNQNKNLNLNTDELQKLRAQINRVTQQSADKSNQYEQRIYQLELKAQKLQKQLRNGQMFVDKNQQKMKDFEIRRVQDVHQNCFLKANLSQLLDPKKHALLKLDRSFIYKKKRQRSISVNKHHSKNLH